MREKGQALFLFIQEYQPFGDTAGSFFFFFSLSQCARLPGFLSVDGYVSLKDFLDPAWMFSGRFFMEKKEAFCTGVKEIKVFGNTRARARRGYF